MGSNFDIGSTIVIDGEDVETENDSDSPAFGLIAGKANQKIARGQTVVIRVRNPDGILSRAVQLQTSRIGGMWGVCLGQRSARASNVSAQDYASRNFVKRQFSQYELARCRLPVQPSLIKVEEYPSSS